MKSVLTAKFWKSVNHLITRKMSGNPISSGNDINEEETTSDNSSKGPEVGLIATSTTEKDKVLKLIAQ